MYKGFKIRLYPTKEQEQKIWQHIGACRFVWNYLLNYQEDLYKIGSENHLYQFDMIKMIPSIKRKYSWLNDVSCASLQIVCGNLCIAYKKYFAKLTNKPKFKSKKKSKQTFPVCNAVGKLYFKNDTVHIQKVGDIKYNAKHQIPQSKDTKFICAYISYINKKWILTMSIECESQTRELNGKMGIDLGIKELAVVSYNDKQIVFNNINKSKRVRTLKSKLKHLQRKVARKYNTNGNYNKSKAIEKTESQIKEIYYHLSNIRNNYIHKCTHKLIEMFPSRVVMEDLNVLAMLKNKHLSDLVAEQHLYEFIRQMKYKCKWNGIEFIQANRYFSSSKTCSKCGNIKRNLKLSDRTYHCSKCGLIIDRDYNAAINLMNYGT